MVVYNVRTTAYNRAQPAAGVEREITRISVYRSLASNILMMHVSAALNHSLVCGYDHRPREGN